MIGSLFTNRHELYVGLLDQISHTPGMIVPSGNLIICIDEDFDPPTSVAYGKHCYLFYSVHNCAYFAWASSMISGFIKSTELVYDPKKEKN
jgi:hypothetical protein